MSLYEIPVPLQLKLSMNQRMHWAVKNKFTQQLRMVAKLGARSQGIGEQPERITVGLVWTVKDRIERDPANLMPTQKALVDGLVDAGVVPKDTPAYVLETVPTIDYDPTVKPALTFWVETFDQYGEDAA